MRSFALVFMAVSGLSACVTAPVRYDLQLEGQWQAKALIRDKRAGKSAVVGLDINAIREQQMRMDVTAAMGHPVASLVMNGNAMTYVLIEQKQYYKGAATAGALKPILAMPLEPKLLYNVMFDLPIADKSWTCTSDNKGYLSECKNMGSETTIRWSERQGRRKLISLDHASGSVQISVSKFQPKVEDRAQLFELLPPKSFKALR
ncbi:MAG: hypothetical protein AB7N80_12640 [Bdellovibrionales bacterium]